MKLQDYVSKEEVDEVLKVTPSPDHAVSVLNALCRARGWSGEDLVLACSDNSIIGRQKPYVYLYETEYAFL
jgi:hypothetical protein